MVKLTWPQRKEIVVGRRFVTCTAFATKHLFAQPPSGPTRYAHHRYIGRIQTSMKADSTVSVTSPATGAAPPADAGSSGQWRRAYGPHWRPQLAILGLLLVARGALETLGDTDLPIHLALGEWVFEHRTVPFVEPFAWTRAGDPFFAYSWLAELLYYLLAESGGKVALRILHGLTVAGAAASMLVLGRAARWPPRTSLVMAALNVIILSALVAPVRPQGFLFGLIPLAWAFNYSALTAARPRPSLAGITIVAAICANTHIFFPLTAVPWVLLLATPPRERWRACATVAATLIGWLISPYALAWPAVFGLNILANPLLAFPSPINEAVPGFLALRWNWLALCAGICLAMLPWLSQNAQLSARARLVFASAWLAGLVAFAGAFRLLLVWWMMVLPLASSAVSAICQSLASSENQKTRLLRITAVWAVCAGLILSSGRFEAHAWNSEDPANARVLAPMNENGLEQIAEWLDCNAREGSGGRVFTYFSYGSALTWRLSHYSMSIDGRTIFPDSVAKPEAFYDPLTEPFREGPWRTANLAILPARSAIADVLDNAPGWRRAAVVHRATGSIALWVTEAWWSTAGIGPPPSRAIPLSETYACASRQSVAR